MRASRFRAVVLTALLGAACTADQLDFARQLASITNGQPDNGGHPAVGILRIEEQQLPGGLCSATLVGQRTILTAAHCLVGDGVVEFLLPAEQLIYRTVSRTKHPEFDEGRVWPNDIAVVELKTTPTVQRAKIAVATPTVGSSVTMVGFGETARGAGDAGEGRRAINTIAGVEPLYFTVTGATGSAGIGCYGDSGGPVLVDIAGEEGIAGVMSYIEAPGSCGSTQRCTRVDLMVEWLREASKGDIEIADPIAPQASIESPADGATVTSPSDVMVAATDNIAVTSVQLRVNGIPSGEPLSVPPYRFDKVPLYSPSSTIEATARDDSGNETSASVAVEVIGGAPDPNDVKPTDSGDQAVGGCSTSGGTPAGPGLLLLLLLLLGVSPTGGAPRRVRRPSRWQQHRPNLYRLASRKRGALPQLLALGDDHDAVLCLGWQGHRCPQLLRIRLTTRGDHDDTASRSLDRCFGDQGQALADLDDDRRLGCLGNRALPLGQQGIERV